MRHPRLTVFAGAMISLAAMHVMSAFFGYATTVIPRVYTYYLSSFLFAIFGVKRFDETADAVFAAVGADQHAAVDGHRCHGF